MAVNVGSNVMKVYMYLNDFNLFSKGFFSKMKNIIGLGQKEGWGIFQLQ